MKTVLLTVCMFASCLFLASCGEEQPSPQSAEDVPTPAGHAQTKSSDGVIEGLTLNDGRKWEMDEHTRSAFASMADTFPADGLASLNSEQLKEAGAVLQGQLTGLIRGCTMQGAAHDQLHVFLTGFMPAVKALSENGQPADAETVKLYLEGYDEYFE